MLRVLQARLMATCLGQRLRLGKKQWLGAQPLFAAGGKYAVIVQIPQYVSQIPDTDTAQLWRLLCLLSGEYRGQKNNVAHCTFILVDHPT